MTSRTGVPSRPRAATQRVCVIPGDDAAPEAVRPALGVLKQLELPIDYLELPSGEEGTSQYGERFLEVCREAIDGSDTTLFGSSSGKTPALQYLRWGKDTYANVRPVRHIAGASSPLARPEGIDFVIVRENVEDLYVGIEGDLSELRQTHLVGRRGNVLPDTGRFAIKVITERNSERIAHFAFQLAGRRKAEGGRGKVTAACKHNMLPQTDGLFREVVRRVSHAYPEIEFEDFIVDDFARRIVATPQDLDVVVLPNLYGDILSDEASALVGGLGMAPSACYGEDFAYFEPVHGTAPDIAGTGRINPTATLLSAVMMLEYLGQREGAERLRQAIERVYGGGRVLPGDQGGEASADEFCRAVAHAL